MAMVIGSGILRPYTLTGGRTHTRHRLLVHTLVSVPSYDPRFAARLPPETRSIYEHARTATSVAELAAVSRLPIGVARVVIDRLAEDNRLQVHPENADGAHDLALLERIRDGLRRLA